MKKPKRKKPKIKPNNDPLQHVQPEPYLELHECEEFNRLRGILAASACGPLLEPSDGVTLSMYVRTSMKSKPTNVEKRLLFQLWTQLTGTKTPGRAGRRRKDEPNEFDQFD